MDWLRRFVFQGSPAKRTCGHVDQIEVTDRIDPVCPDCRSEGTDWVRVRMCMVCGKPGCCDSSRAKHARRHYEETGHPVIRSVEPGESWAWCYPERVYLTGEELDY